MPTITPLLPALACAAALAAQQDRNPAAEMPAPVPLPAGVIPVHSAPDDPVGGAYGTWAAGDDYKVSFHGGMAFVPYLGTAWPENLPLAWRTEAVRIGGRTVWEAAASPEAVPHGRRYEYRYGFLTEAYAVLPHGLEQTFVIPAKPLAGGDLELVGRIATPLRCEATAADHGALVFRDGQGRPIVRYGEAFAVDATGSKVPIDTGWDGAGRIVLRVPARIVHAAAFPLVLDPLLTPVALASGVGAGSAVDSTDIAYDDEHDDVMVVHARAASASDWDVVAQIREPDYTNGSIVFTDLNTWNTPEIRVATFDAPVRYLIALGRRFTGNWRVRFRVHDGGDRSLQTAVQSINPALNLQDWRVAVGGTQWQGLGDAALLVFQREDTGSGPPANTANSEIWAVVVDTSTGAALPSPQFRIPALGPDQGASTDLDQEWPEVNKVARRSNNTHWLVVWQEYWNDRPVTDDWDVGGRLVNKRRVVSTARYLGRPTHPDTYHQLRPRVEGHNGRYLVAFTESPLSQLPGKTPLTLGERVALERLDWPNAGTPSIVHGGSYMHGMGTPVMEIGGLGHDFFTDSHWSLPAFRTVGTGVFPSWIDRLGYRGRPVDYPRLDSGNVRLNDAATVFNPDTQDFQVVYAQADPSLGWVYGNRYRYANPRAPVVSGTSCSTAGIAWRNPKNNANNQQIGSEFSGVRLTGAQPARLAFLVIGLGSTDVDLGFLNMPGCRLLVPNAGPNHVGVLSAVTDAAGVAFVRIPLPEWLATFTAHFQYFHLEPGANPLGMVSTRELRVELIR